MNNKIHYFKSIVQNNSKSRLISVIQDSPLKQSDVQFLSDCVYQLSYEELMDKYSMTKDGIYKRKCRCVERFLKFWLNK